MRFSYDDPSNSLKMVIVRHFISHSVALGGSRIQEKCVLDTTSNVSAVIQNVLPLPNCLWHGQKWQYTGHKNNVSRSHEIAAGSVFCNNACRRFIQNASAVLQNVFPLPDCVGHGPKSQYIGHKNNVSRDREIAAGSVLFNIACQKFSQNASAIFQDVCPPPDGFRHGQKWQYIGH